MNTPNPRRIAIGIAIALGCVALLPLPVLYIHTRPPTRVHVPARQNVVIVNDRPQPVIAPEHKAKSAMTGWATVTRHPMPYPVPYIPTRAFFRPCASSNPAFFGRALYVTNLESGQTVTVLCAYKGGAGLLMLDQGYMRDLGGEKFLRVHAEVIR